MADQSYEKFLESTSVEEPDNKGIIVISEENRAESLKEHGATCELISSDSTSTTTTENKKLEEMSPKELREEAEKNNNLQAVYTLRNLAKDKNNYNAHFELANYEYGLYNANHSIALLKPIMDSYEIAAEGGIPEAKNKLVEMSLGILNSKLVYTGFQEEAIRLLQVAGNVEYDNNGNLNEEKCQNGSPEALFQLAQEFDKTHIVLRDGMIVCSKVNLPGGPSRDKAIKLYALAAKKGHKEALRVLEEDFADYCNGFSEAQFEVAKLYIEGEVVEQDFAKAAQLLERASERIPEAQFELAKLYLEKDPSLSQRSEPEELLRKAAEQGHKGALEYLTNLAERNPQARLNLAKLYIDGKGVQQNYTKAAELLSIDAETLPEAQFELAKLYLEGNGVSQDPSKAEELLEKAAENGHTEAQYLMGLRYYYGARKNGVNFSVKDGVICYNFGNDRKFFSTDYEKGMMYFQNIANKEDLWRGHPGAQFQLGLMYFHGHGVTKNYEEAYRYLNFAAKKGSFGASDFLRAHERIFKQFNRQ